MLMIKHALVIPALALAGSVALAADRTFDKHFEAPAGGHLTVDTQGGSVTIVGHDSREVTVHVEISGNGASEFNVNADQDSSGVTVTGRSDSRFHFGVFTLRAKFTIGVPRDYPVDINTAGGAIDVRDLQAPAHGKTSGGSVELRDVAGAVTMHTSGGAIEAERIGGPAELISSGGSVNVKGASGSLKVHTSGGSIEAEVRSNQGIFLETSGGSISLRVPVDLHGAVDARTSGGRVHSDLPIATAESGKGSHIQGTLNGGGEAIYLHTSGGGIQIEAIK